MQYVRIATKEFRKDLRRLKKTGYDLQKLETVINELSSGKELAEHHRDHPLQGHMKGSRECHISPDWLLRYTKKNNILVLLLISTGDHRHVLGIE